jgi:uncharacterized protein YndB with AHSA1/START domain
MLKNPEAAVRTTDREIVITRTFDAPRSVVFDAWTKPEHVKHWWDPTGAPLASCEIDLRPNGQFKFGGAGMQHSFAGTYREVSVPSRLVFTTVVSPSGNESIGTVAFDEKGGQTTLTVTIACATEEDLKAMLQMQVHVGTVRTIENLAEYIQRKQ